MVISEPIPLLRSAMLACLLLCGPSMAVAEAPPTVAAASVLRFALPEIADAFSARAGSRPRLSFGSSGNLRRQIAQGAPFALFLSADERFPLELARDGLTVDDGRIYAEGRLALLLRKDSPRSGDGAMPELADLLADGRLRHLAIANPETAPYGRAARQVLEHLARWESIQSTLVVGENVAQAAQFVVSGGAEAGIIAYPLTLSAGLRACCRSAPIPTEMHARMVQRGVLTKQGGDDARAFFRFLLGPEGSTILQRHGFGLPRAGSPRVGTKF